MLTHCNVEFRKYQGKSILLAIKFICGYKIPSKFQLKEDRGVSKYTGRKPGSKNVLQPNELKAYLAREGMTLKDFAYIIEYNDTYITAVINGRVPASKRLISKIRTYTGRKVDLEYLLRAKEPDIKKEYEDTQEAA
jgi:plasmid maintenance system antidote protein VapI